MIIIGSEEISELKNRCDACCEDEEFCLFGFQKSFCPVQNGCFVYENIKSKTGQLFSVLNDRSN